MFVYKCYCTIDQQLYKNLVKDVDPRMKIPLEEDATVVRKKIKQQPIIFWVTLV